MKALLITFIYNILYTLGWLVTLPSYFLKQKRRGGFGSGLRERFGIYTIPYNEEPKGGLYVHAVSVGEVLIATKFIRAWLKENGGVVVLATSTATGHATALEADIPNVRVIYAPFDLYGLPGRCFDRFEPEAIVLVEAEIWPNFARAAQVRGIPMAMINARMSARSEGRYKKFKWMSEYLFGFLSAMGVQDTGDERRFLSVGVRSSIIDVTGSIKFDQQSAERPEKNQEFATILDHLKREKPVVLAASTHDGEEALIAAAIKKAGAFPLIVPRHAERRYAVVRDLEAQGWQVILRTTGEIPETLKEYVCYVADTTGELRDWTALADLAVIGKSFLADGGQNPAEAVACGVPVLTGPHMENFEALVQLLEGVDGISRCDADQLEVALKAMLDNPLVAHAQASRAQVALKAHYGATERSIRMIQAMLKMPI